MDSTLWPVFDPDGRSVGLRVKDGGKVLCLFSRKVLAERWLIDVGLTGHIVGKGLTPTEIARFCDVAAADGFAYWIVNPPLQLGGRVQMATLLSLKEQAVAKI